MPIIRDPLLKTCALTQAQGLTERGSSDGQRRPRWCWNLMPSSRSTCEMMPAMQQAPRRHVSCVLAGHLQHNRMMPVSFAASMATIQQQH